MKQRKKNGERIVKAKPSGYEERRVRRLGQVRLLVGVLLLAVIAGSAWFTWERIMVPYEGKGGKRFFTKRRKGIFSRRDSSGVWG